MIAAAAAAAYACARFRRREGHDWPLFTQYSKEQAEAYLSSRAAKGFTVIQGVLAWGHGSGMEQKSPVANPQGQKPWIDDDPTKPNPAYFEYVDHLVDYANRQGLVLAMLPTWGYYVKEVPVLNTRNARAYGRWLGARYKAAPNVVWVNGGAHLITYHPCGWRSSAQFFHGEDWLDFNMIETWTEWAKIYPAVVADGLRAPRKPVVLGEGAYEDGPEYPQGPISPLLVRRQAWWTAMAGGFHTYGQNQMWWQRAHPQHRHALEGRHPDPDLPLEPHGRLPPPREDRGEDREGHVDQRGHRRDEGSGRLRDRKLQRQVFPGSPTQFFKTPDFWEDAVLLLEGVDR